MIGEIVFDTHTHTHKICFTKPSCTNPVNKARGIEVSVVVFDEYLN